MLSTQDQSNVFQFWKKSTLPLVDKSKQYFEQYMENLLDMNKKL